MTTPKKYDAVLVGAGHNSLVCANYLARAGLKVLVLEARNIIGGACTSEELVPGGIFSSCSYIQMMLRSEVVNDLELGRYGLNSYAPPLQEMALWDDGERIMLWQEIDKTLRSIESHSKADGENFMHFAARLKRFGELTHEIQLSDPPSEYQLRQRFAEAGETELFEEFMVFSAEELLQKYIKSDRLRGFMMFMGLVSTWGGPNTPGTAYVYGYHALGEFEGAFGRFGLPEGGMGMISQSLVDALKAHNGEVRTSSPIQQIIVEDNCATGVLLSSGERIYASMVISGADPTRSLVGLLPEGTLTESVSNEAKKIDQRGSMGRIHLLVDALPDYVGFEPGTTGPQHQCLTIMGASPALYEMAAEAQNKGEFPDDMVIESLIPSVTHPGLVTKPGTHTLSLGVQQLPFELAEGDWDSRKEEWADKVLEIYFRYAPNMHNHIIAHHVITPLDLHRDYNITNGNIFHQSMVGLENLFDQRPIQSAAHYRTPLPGYYLCGSGSHPGGGVSGMPGHNAAQRILADLAGLEDSVAGRKIEKADRNFLNGLLKTDVGRKLGYQVARSRVFRSLTKHLSK
ncbi:phytoene desaturase family protein [Pantoea cypripedii]|uniref:Pyridine nucleotide-disulfide oxidoreductase domain-containing protein 2 n=1 Tax=Pantoea cypripedii TaxID=55209 RepID=A0A6B9GI35_PANCY|nr:NAD(P)/FAD-dependent oxidoreductase [Pantoea cypripedii]QGY33206.1 NAD(P)/FAD-dependent oxidoreductase [Pantoea cypripedii]